MTVKDITSVTLNVQLTVYGSDGEYSNPRGQSYFQVNLPAGAMDAVDVGKLIKPLLAKATAEYELEVAKANIELEAV